MRNYKRKSEMSQESWTKYQAKRQRIDAKPKRADAEQRRNYARHEHQWSLDPATTELAVVDGEADDNGHYNLFQEYSPSIGMATLRAGDTGRLGLLQCADFMWKNRRRIKKATGKRTKHLYFSAGYDISQQVAFDPVLTDEQKHAIWHMRSRSFGAVRGPEHRPEIEVPQARATVQLTRKTGYVKFQRGRYEVRVDWSDIFSLFARGFVAVMRDYQKFWSAEEHTRMDSWLEAVEAGKEARGQWAQAGYADTEIETMYQEPELKLMHWLASHIVKLCQEVGLHPKSLAGPAPMARALLHKFGCTSHLKPADYDTVEFQSGPINSIVRQAFFGGNIQSSVFGRLPEHHKVDITSAYPAEIAKLPCGAHGYWNTLDHKDLRKANEKTVYPYCIYHIVWACPKDTVWPPFPVRRKNNSILYPLKGEGWYCSAEIQAFFDCHPKADYNITEGIQWISTCEHDHPFDEMIELTYNQRNEYKKTKNPAGNILKLALNSLYGVMAQTMGTYREVDDEGNTIGWHTPKTSNLFLAAMITSGCRAKIMHAIAKNPENVFSIMTDAILTFAPQDMEVIESEDKESDRPLGGWEHERSSDPAILVAPGIIGHAEGNDKFRGVPTKCVWHVGERPFDTMYDALSSALADGHRSVSARFEKYHNPFDAGTTNETAGRFLQSEREINITPSALQTKRDPTKAREIAPQLWYLPPYKSSISGASHIYMRPADEGAYIYERPERFDT